LCIRGTDIVSFYIVILLDFGAVPTVCYICHHFISEHDTFLCEQIKQMTLTISDSCITPNEQLVS
jgi:hypothetical protein